jgi:tetratricopeptide (TPR) repeat protein
VRRSFAAVDPHPSHRWKRCTPCPRASSDKVSSIARKTLASQGLARTRDPQSEAATRFTLLQAEIALFRRDLASARSLLARSIPANSNFDALRARQRYLDGQLLLIDARWDESLKTLDDAVNAAAAARARDVELDARILKGQALFRLQRWTDADRELEATAADAGNARDEYRQATALHNLGVSQLFRNRYDSALPYFEQVLAFKELDSYTIHATALTNAALCEARLGDFDRALATLDTPCGCTRSASRRSTSSRRWVRWAMPISSAAATRTRFRCFAGR